MRGYFGQKIDDRGFCFSPIGKHKRPWTLSSHKAKAELSLEKPKDQFAFCGEISTVSKEEADEYYASRPFGESDRSMGIRAIPPLNFVTRLSSA